MTALPINVDELLRGQIVEWERLEFKKGWNPEETIRTICAFANDISNWGGGYLVVGVEEDNGQPIFPPIGISANKVDEIQKELVNLCYRLRPNYHPIVAPVIFQEKMILMIWCPGGQTRPYQAPDTLGKHAPYSYFIRRNSTTVKAQTKDVQRLHEMANQVPFDDRICHQASLKDLQIGIIKDFLRDVKSDLISEVDKIPLEQLYRQMQIVQGPEEHLKPLNIGLMMFNNNPEQFFPCARIEIVEFHDDVGDSFSEKIFKGPIHIQLKEALRYLQSMFIKEEIRKRPDRAEADRFYNYPYVALEEALANAVYHKDYAQREPIEISIRPDRIEILSFPGPLPPLKIEDLNKGCAYVRTYRNRRIGDFLKELHLTEGRCTGVPKIHKAMVANGSPPAIFETDEESHYFLTVLPIHPEARRVTVASQNTPVEEQTHQYTGVFGTQTHQYTGVFALEILPEELQMLLNEFNKRSSVKDLHLLIQKLCAWQPLTAQQLVDLLKRKDKKHFVRSHLTPMIKEGTLKYLFPKDGNAPNQAYICEKKREAFE
ncbi:MAG: putative DNA binding domain-containing protein [Verrucomicrobia bacterium]|nr:putative DNA binding domain-containing protein [Verrucomicrobiota bacterium]